MHRRGNNKLNEKTAHRLGKIFANDVTQGFVSKIYKQHMMLNIIQANNSIKKGAEDLNRYFHQRRHVGGQEAHKKMFNIANY